MTRELIQSFRAQFNGLPLNTRLMRDDFSIYRPTTKGPKSQGWIQHRAKMHYRGDKLTVQRRSTYSGAGFVIAQETMSDFNEDTRGFFRMPWVKPFKTIQYEEPAVAIDSEGKKHTLHRENWGSDRFLIWTVDSDTELRTVLQNLAISDENVIPLGPNIASIPNIDGIFASQIIPDTLTLLGEQVETGTFFNMTCPFEIRSNDATSTNATYLEAVAHAFDNELAERVRTVDIPEILRREFHIDQAWRECSIIGGLQEQPSRIILIPSVSDSASIEGIIGMQYEFHDTGEHSRNKLKLLGNKTDPELEQQILPFETMLSDTNHGISLVPYMFASYIFQEIPADLLEQNSISDLLTRVYLERNDISSWESFDAKNKRVLYGNREGFNIEASILSSTADNPFVRAATIERIQMYYDLIGGNSLDARRNLSKIGFLSRRSDTRDKLVAEKLLSLSPPSSRPTKEQWIKIIDIAVPGFKNAHAEHPSNKLAEDGESITWYPIANPTTQEGGQDKAPWGTVIGYKFKRNPKYTFTESRPHNVEPRLEEFDLNIGDITPISSKLKITLSNGREIILNPSNQEVEISIPDSEEKFTISTGINTDGELPINPAILHTLIDISGDANDKVSWQTLKGKPFKVEVSLPDESWACLGENFFIGSNDLEWLENSNRVHNQHSIFSDGEDVYKLDE